MGKIGTVCPLPMNGYFGPFAGKISRGMIEKRRDFEKREIDAGTAVCFFMGAR
jgi:hypothetical protein